jgi:hypothetical protein
MSLAGQIPDRIMARRVITESGCWEWSGSRSSQGYGRITWQGKTVGVHRLIGHLVHGMDLRGRHCVARHACDNPPCFNPDHILPGTYLDNWDDAVARGRARGFGVPRTKCDNGHELTPENTTSGGRGRRRCRICARAQTAAYYPTRKAHEAERIPCSACGAVMRRDSIRIHRAGNACRRAAEDATQ